MRRMRHPSHVVSIAVYDAVPDQQRLLAATLYGLGCRTMPLDCGSAAPDKLAAQLADTPPDVLVWHLGEPKAGQCASLLRLLEGGSLSQSGIVVATAVPAQALSDLGHMALAVTMLPAPYTLNDLMCAVNSAEQDRDVAVRH